MSSIGPNSRTAFTNPVRSCNRPAGSVHSEINHCLAAQSRLREVGDVGFFRAERRRFVKEIPDRHAERLRQFSRACRGKAQDGYRKQVRFHSSQVRCVMRQVSLGA